MDDAVTTAGQVVDAWTSTSGAYGAYDKRTTYTLLAGRMSPSAGAAFYRTSDVAQLVVDAPVQEALRAGWEVEVEGDDDGVAARAAYTTLEDLGATGGTGHVAEAVRIARACGGAGILLLSNDADLATPWGPRSRVTGLQVFAADELQATTEYVSSIDSPAYGLPAYYRLQPKGLLAAGADAMRVHHSRVVRVCPRTLDRAEIQARMGWGPPLLESLQAPIKDFEIAYSEALGLLPDFAQGSISLVGLNRALAEGNGEALKARWRLLDAARSLHRPLPLDAGDGQGTPAETYERHPTPVSGLGELLDRAANRLSTAARIPVSVLLGQQPSGLGQTGDASMRGWYDLVETVQDRYLRPAFEALLRAVWGPTEPARWHIEFEPLWQPTEAEEAATSLAQASADEKYFALGVLSAEEIRARRFPALGPMTAPPPPPAPEPDPVVP